MASSRILTHVAMRSATMASQMAREWTLLREL